MKKKLWVRIHIKFVAYFSKYFFGSAVINKMVEVSYIDCIGHQPLGMIGEFIFRKDVNVIGL